VNLWRLTEQGDWVLDASFPDAYSSFDYESVVFSPDGSLLAAGGNGVVDVWSVSDGSLKRSFLGDRWQRMASIAFSPDGELIAAGSWGGRNLPEIGDVPIMLRIWRVSDAALLHSFSAFSSIAFSPDGATLLAGTSDGSIRFIRVDNGATIFEESDDIYSVASVAFSPNNRTYAFNNDSDKIVVARSPLLITRISQAAGNAILSWQGGAGLYQLQRSSQAAGGTWENLGPSTTSMSATNAPDGPAFYRIQTMPPLPN